MKVTFQGALWRECLVAAQCLCKNNQSKAIAYLPLSFAFFLYMIIEKGFSHPSSICSPFLFSPPPLHGLINSPDSNYFLPPRKKNKQKARVNRIIPYRGGRGTLADPILSPGCERLFWGFHNPGLTLESPLLPGIQTTRCEKKRPVVHVSNPYAYALSTRVSQVGSSDSYGHCTVWPALTYESQINVTFKWASLKSPAMFCNRDGVSFKSFPPTHTLFFFFLYPEGVMWARVLAAEQTQKCPFSNII